VKVLATPSCPVSSLNPLIEKLAAAEIEDAATEPADGAVAFMVETTRYALLLGDLVDNEAEKEKAIAEIKRLEGFLMGVNKKLENERFVSSAPAAVVELERKKKADAETKIEALKKQFKL
jgi:valyl-tRNA synthetase